jgi:hypothetical protein
MEKPNKTAAVTAAKEILGIKRKSESITITDFKLYHRAIVVKTIWYWQRTRHETQHKPRQLQPFDF